MAAARACCSSMGRTSPSSAATRPIETDTSLLSWSRPTRTPSRSMSTWSLMPTTTSTGLSNCFTRVDDATSSGRWFSPSATSGLAPIESRYLTTSTDPTHAATWRHVELFWTRSPVDCPPTAEKHTSKSRALRKAFERRCSCFRTEESDPSLSASNKRRVSLRPSSAASASSSR